MINTLEELKSGTLLGTKRLKLSCDLKEFPKEILLLHETLEILDLSNNKLSSLPDNIVKLKKLKIIFLSFNDFIEFPAVLANFPVLNMIGFKANQIKTIPENAFPEKLNWLILTDNKIEKIPDSIGNYKLLQKFMMAGNLIKELPKSLYECKNLELFRISNNKIKVLPEWLFKMPKLSWIAFEGNKEVKPLKLGSNLKSFNWKDFEIVKDIGEGASGVISEAFWKLENKKVAIKIFKGAVTSDGSPDDEMKIAIEAGIHENLIPVLGKINNHPRGNNGLILELIPNCYSNLGNPPNFKTCTRDVFDGNKTISLKQALKIATYIASVCAHLHNKGINHGDLYAHNILINTEMDCLLCDFGAASLYDRNSAKAYNIERIEIRAFGCLLEDLLNLTNERANETDLYFKCEQIIDKCRNYDVKKRFSFSEILNIMRNLV